MRYDQLITLMKSLFLLFASSVLKDPQIFTIFHYMQIVNMKFTQLLKGTISVSYTILCIVGEGEHQPLLHLLTGDNSGVCVE